MSERIYKIVQLQERKMLCDETTETLEVVVSLFTDCNMKCEFCADRDRKEGGTDTETFERKWKLLKRVISSMPHKEIALKIFGGELFQTKFSQPRYKNVYEDLEIFLDVADIYCKSLGKTLTVAFSTNLTIEDPKPLIDFAKKYNADVRISFDFVGRFTKDWMLETFEKNVDILLENDITPMLAVVMSKANFDVIRDENNQITKIFKKFYEKIPVIFDYYDDWDTIPHQNITENIDESKYRMTEQDTYCFLKYLLDNYPKVLNISDIINEINNPPKVKHCSHGVAIMDNIYWECCNLSKASENHKKAKGCLTCEHFTYCVGTCVRLFDQGEFCHLKELYNAIKARLES